MIKILKLNNMKRTIRFLTALLLLLLGSGTAGWAMKVKNELGSNATVTFYYYGTSAPDAGTFDPASPGIALTVGTEFTPDEYSEHYIVAHIVPADGYWTDASLVGAMDYAMAVTRNSGMEIDFGNVMTFLLADEGHTDGSGWYYYQVPEDHADYIETSIIGIVVPKFDLSTASVSGTTLTVSRTSDDWVAEVKINKTSFTYNGSTQCPAVNSISIKKGTTVMASPSATGNISVTGGQVNSGSYTATLSGDAGGLFTESKGFAYTISKGTINVTAKDWSGQYDGYGHSITLKVNSPSGTTVKYRTRSTGTYNLTKNPTFADVGNYTVYYQITKSNYNTVTGSKKVTISAANVAYSGGTIKLDQNGYDITLNEGTGSAKPLPVSGHIDDLDYSRKLTTPPVSDGGDAGDGEEDHTGDTVIDDKDANLYTVCLPYVPVTTDEEGNDIEEVTYYTLSSVSGTTLNFTEVQNEDVAAFTPYLVAITGESDYTLSCKDVSFEAEERIISKTVQGDAGIFTFCGTLIGLTNEEAVACSKDVVTAGAIADAVAKAVAEAIAADEDAATDPDRAAAIAEAVTAEVTPGITAEVNAAVEAAIAEGTVYETYILQTGATWGKMKSETAAQRKIYIPPFRAFIAGPDVEVPAEARKLDSSFSGNEDNGATGINSIRTIDRGGTERWYDLSGRRIASPSNGIYISNGKKINKK